MTARETAAGRYRCALCSHAFDEGADTTCGSCPMHRGTCGLVKCPRCGYEFPGESRVVGWLRRVLSPRRSS